jgi:hypothetical protein
MLTYIAALLGVGAASADCPEPTYPKPGCFYEWVSEGEVCEWIYFPGDDPGDPGGCYTLNTSTCEYEAPPQPGTCYTMDEYGCWSLPVQPYDCYVWNGPNCSWDLPASPGMCYAIVNGCWVFPPEPTDGFCHEFDWGNCSWGYPTAPGTCYYQDAYMCWHEYPACESWWQHRNEYCTCVDTCPSANGPPPDNLYDCYTWNYQVCEWVYTGPTCTFPYYLDGCECAPLPGYCQEI